MALTPAVFLDKDGTLLIDVPYNVEPGRMHFAPGVPEGLALLRKLGWPLVVISNQPGLALGIFDQAQWQRCCAELNAMCRRAGAPLAGIFHCPHVALSALGRRFSPGCSCRKPQPGLIRHAAAVHDIEVRRSWMIGDILNDVEAGGRAGCQTVLIDNGNETEWEQGAARVPTYIAADFEQAAAFIVRSAATSSQATGVQQP